MKREISQMLMMNGGRRQALWVVPVLALRLYFTSQGYLTHGRSKDPDWADRTAVLKAEGAPKGPVALDSWGGSAEAELLQQSVSRHAGAPAILNNVFVVRDKPLGYSEVARKNDANPLLRPHVSGYPLIFCGHASVNGKPHRFSYVPEIQELILLDGASTSKADLARDDWREVRRSRKVEKEYLRMCTPSLESEGVRLSGL